MVIIILNSPSGCDWIAPQLAANSVCGLIMGPKPVSAGSAVKKVVLRFWHNYEKSSNQRKTCKIHK